MGLLRCAEIGLVVSLSTSLTNMDCQRKGVPRKRVSDVGWFGGQTGKDCFPFTRHLRG